MMANPTGYDTFYQMLHAGNMLQGEPHRATHDIIVRVYNTLHIEPPLTARNAVDYDKALATVDPKTGKNPVVQMLNKLIEKDPDTIASVKENGNWVKELQEKLERGGLLKPDPSLGDLVVKDNVYGQNTKNALKQLYKNHPVPPLAQLHADLNNHHSGPFAALDKHHAAAKPAPHPVADKSVHAPAPHADHPSELEEWLNKKKQPDKVAPPASPTIARHPDKEIAAPIAERISIPSVEPLTTSTIPPSSMDGVIRHKGPDGTYLGPIANMPDSDGAAFLRTPESTAVTQTTPAPSPALKPAITPEKPDAPAKEVVGPPTDKNLTDPAQAAAALVQNEKERAKPEPRIPAPDSAKGSVPLQPTLKSGLATEEKPDWLNATVDDMKNGGTSITKPSAPEAPSIQPEDAKKKPNLFSKAEALGHKLFDKKKPSLDANREDPEFPDSGIRGETPPEPEHHKKGKGIFGLFDKSVAIADAAANGSKSGGIIGAVTGVIQHQKAKSGTAEHPETNSEHTAAGTDAPRQTTAKSSLREKLAPPPPVTDISQITHVPKGVVIFEVERTKDHKTMYVGYDTTMHHTVPLNRRETGIQDITLGADRGIEHGVQAVADLFRSKGVKQERAKSQELDQYFPSIEGMVIHGTVKLDQLPSRPEKEAGQKPKSATLQKE